MGYDWYKIRTAIVLYTLSLLLLAHINVQAQERKSEEIYQETIQSIATLIVEKTDGSLGIGNAFMGVKDGLAVTAWHVVKDAKRVQAKFSNGEEFEVSGLVDKDEKRDVAIIKIKVFGRPSLATNPADPPIGSKSYIIGAPKGLEFAISEGLVSQIQTIDGIKYYQFSCPASPGSSGGPLVNAKGEVIGVVSWQVSEGQNLNFAIPISYVLGLDNTLPTQPWLSVKTELPMVNSTATDLAMADTILADSCLSAIDASVAVQGSLEILSKPAYKDKTNFWTGDTNRTWQLYTPVYLFECQKELSSKQKDLASLIVDGPRAKLRDDLIKVLYSFSEAVQGLIDTIKMVQTKEGWSPEAQELVGRSVAALPKGNPIDKPILLEVAKSKDFLNRIPEDVQIMTGLIQNSNWFPMQVFSFCRNPLTFTVVEDKGLAYKMGFRSGDTLLKFAGETPSSILNLKTIINANLGKEVESIVQREDKEVKLKIKIPKEISSN